GSFSVPSSPAETRHRPGPRRRHHPRPRWHAGQGVRANGPGEAPGLRSRAHRRERDRTEGFRSWLPLHEKARNPGQEPVPMWHSGPMKLPPILLLTIAIVFPCRADCVPEKMVKVVLRDVTPGIDRASFAAKPRTLYRWGSKYGRTEEALDSRLKIHGLIVVNEPDLFMVNLATRTGQHIVDTGGPYHFHAPIVGGADDP